MQLELLLFYLMIGILVFDFIIDRGLSWLNLRHWSPRLPDFLQSYYDEKEYLTSMRYSRARSRISLLSSVVSFLLILLVLSFGLFGVLDSWSRQFTDHPILLALLFLGVLGILSELAGLPFSIYSTFKIEEAFGFNKMTPRLFFFDKIKSYLLALILGGGILALMVFLFEHFGDRFWLLAWICVAGFSIFMNLFYSNLIVPLFNKQVPLDDGELKDEIEAFAGKTGFQLDNIYVIDGSKRSTKANAYFTGFWKKKRIVLYDTLIKEQSKEEIVAVLAHEIGHYKLHHTIRQLVSGLIQMGILFFVLGLFLKKDGTIALAVSEALQVEPSFHTGIIAFGILFSPISHITGIIGNIISRKNEYAADRFAAEHYDAAYLVSALIHLSRKNLNNLNPHPWYVWYHYSHPTLLQRIAALEALSKTTKE